MFARYIYSRRKGSTKLNDKIKDWIQRQTWVPLDLGNVKMHEEVSARYKCHAWYYQEYDMPWLTIKDYNNLVSCISGSYIVYIRILRKD